MAHEAGAAACPDIGGCEASLRLRKVEVEFEFEGGSEGEGLKYTWSRFLNEPLPVTADIAKLLLESLG